MTLLSTLREEFEQVLAPRLLSTPRTLQFPEVPNKIIVAIRPCYLLLFNP